MKYCSPTGKLMDKALKKAERKRIAAVPAAGERRIQVDQQASHDKVGHFRNSWAQTQAPVDTRTPA
jgi:hypothetical protein